MDEHDENHVERANDGQHLYIHDGDRPLHARFERCRPLTVVKGPLESKACRFSDLMTEIRECNKKLKQSSDEDLVSMDEDEIADAEETVDFSLLGFYLRLLTVKDI